MIRELEKNRLCSAEIEVPVSKSQMHRALIAASCANGISHIQGSCRCADILRTKEALEKAGAKIEEENGTVTVTGRGLHLPQDAVIDCGESGSTLRFLIPLFALEPGLRTCRLHGRLKERPLDVYEAIWKEKGLRFMRENDAVYAEGGLKAGSYRADGTVSSQFISGLLMALPLCTGDSVLTVTGRTVSSPYIRMTEEILAEAGITVRRTDTGWQIPGGQTYCPFEFACEKSWSSAAFFATAGILSERPVRLAGMNPLSVQADKALTDILRRMNGDVRTDGDGIVFHPSVLTGTEIDLRDTPDLGTVLFVLAACAGTPSVFTNCGHLRLKESDRIESMRLELAKAGCRMDVQGDSVTVYPADLPDTIPVLCGHNDHRVVMALSLLAFVSKGPVRITDTQAVNKSWPEFFDELKKTGIRVTEIQTETAAGQNML